MLASALQLTGVLGADLEDYRRSVDTRIDYLAARGAGFHNDVSRHCSRCLFWLLALDLSEVDLGVAAGKDREGSTTLVALQDGDGARCFYLPAPKAVQCTVLSFYRKTLAARVADADTACIDTPHTAWSRTMNTTLRTAPRFASAAFAAVMTLATLMGVGQLADHGTAAVQMAQAKAVQHVSV